MKSTHLLRGFVLLAVLIAAGCVHALNPFYRSQDVKFDPSMVGQWRDEEEAAKNSTNSATWTFTQAEGNGYDLKITGFENEKPMAMEYDVHLFHLEGHRFLDIFPTKAEAKKVNEPYSWLAFFRPSHTVIHLPASEGQLVLQILDPKELEAYAEKHPRTVPFEKHGDRLLLTGSTGRLQQLLRESLQRTNWWGDGVKLSRLPK